MSKKKHLLMLSCLVVFMVGVLFSYSMVAYADGEDVTAPTIDSMSFAKAQYSKGDSFDVTFNITEEGTGVKSVSFSFYGYKNGQLVGLGGYEEYQTPKYTKDCPLTMNVKISTDSVAATYYIGQIDIEDYKGNKRTYWNGWSENGYDQDNKGYYVRVGSNGPKCYVDGGNTITVNSSGDDMAPAVKTVDISSAEVKIGDTVTLTMEVEEESQISDVGVSLYTYKGNQSIMMNTSDPKMTITGTAPNYTVKYSFTVSTDTVSGKYYLGGVTITDSHNNSRPYWNSYRAEGYDRDANGTYVAETSLESNRFYVIDGKTITVLSNGDEQAPVITEVAIKKRETIKPGVITLTVSASDNESIKDIWFSLYTTKGNDLYTIDGSSYDINSKSGDFVITAPVPTDKPSGDYYLGQIDIIDYSGNHRTYWNGWNTAGYDVDDKGAYIPDTFDDKYKAYVKYGRKVVVKEEFEVAFEMGLSNPDLLPTIGRLKAGETGKIRIDGDQIAEKEIFEAIKGKDVRLVFYVDNYQWVFEGEDITTPKNINLNITFDYDDGSQYGLDKDSLLINFADNGQLPGKANIRIKSDYTYQIFSMSRGIELYYINDNNELELEEDSDIRYVLDGTDHWCWFEVTHNSSYLATGSDSAQGNGGTDLEDPQGDDEKRVKPSGDKDDPSNNNNSPSDDKINPDSHVPAGDKGSDEGKPDSGDPAQNTEAAPTYSNEWVDGKWYNADGTQTYEGTMSWKSDSTGWWMEDTTGWYPTSTWQKIDGYWYYFGKSGYMASSEWIDGWWISSDGSCTYGETASWKSDSTGWYYLDTSGWYPWSQWQKIDGSWYYFDYYGYMVTNKRIDGYWIGADGVCQ